MKITFISIGASGHIMPNLPVLRELAKRGHQITIAVPFWSRPVLDSYPFKFLHFPYPSIFLDPAVLRQARFDGMHLPALPDLYRAEVSHAAPSILDVLTLSKPDLCIVDGHTIAGMMACEAHGIPWVRADATISTDYIDLCEKQEWPATLSSEETLKAFDTAADEFFTLYGGEQHTFHEWFTKRGALNISYVCPRLHPNIEQHPHVKFVGPCIDDEGAPPIKDGWKPDSAGRRVMVSFGSVFHNNCPAVIDMVHEMLGWLGADAVNLPGGGSPVRRDLRILDGCNLFINHGGMGCVQEGLWRGVPSLCIPMFPDQAILAKMVQDNELGSWLPREAVSLQSLAEEVQVLLKTPDFKDKAFDFGASMRKDGGQIAAADLIEKAV